MTTAAYFLRSRGKTLGPFTLDRLQTMKSRGQLGRTHQVSTDRQTWVAAGSLPELFPHEAATVEFEPIEPAQITAPASAGLPAGPPVTAWFYHAGGQQYGPVPPAEIRRLLSAGELGTDDMVWREGLESWLPIAKVPELGPRSAEAAGGRASRHRRSAAAVTAMCLSIAPWPLYGLGVLAFAIAAASAKHRALTPDDLFAVVVGGAFLSLVLNFSWFVLSVLAVIFGGVAIAQVTQPENRLSGYGMAVTGLVLGIVNVVLLFLWIPIAMAMSAK